MTIVHYLQSIPYRVGVAAASTLYLGPNGGTGQGILGGEKRRSVVISRP